MKSISGAHYVALDHLRGFAAFLVFAWHFMHWRSGYPVSFDQTPVGPLALIDEGHVGVALFMTLSGYLFSKLLEGKDFFFHRFLWNRALRLFPLLVFVFFANAAIAAASAKDLRAAYWYIYKIPAGLVFPTWPNGGWSIAVELHFYLLLPILLMLMRRRLAAAFVVVAAFMLVRVAIFMYGEDIQALSYHTLIGRIDQFILGMVAYNCRELIKRAPFATIAYWVAFVALYWWFDFAGGFYKLPAQYSYLWIFIPTAEGCAFLTLIVWFDGISNRLNGPVSNFFAKIGDYSYSIYLLHFFFVHKIATFIHENIIDISNFYVALPVAMGAFIAMMPIGYISMRFIEQPFLRLKTPYVKSEKNASFVASRA